ncbi:MAG: aminotransferase class III-fold pyridoxal phosphate-dependent enzyme, partial [bacterium]|nr:aminotransferase class III-fold pyridoxal phosphate-dependent enzyme [bacterium]
YEIEPDMVAIGKGIGNGYPVSVTAINSQTVQELENSSFGYAQSHQNDPLGAAIVNEVIKIIKEDDLITKAGAKGSEFIKMVKSLKYDDKIVDVRGRGLMFGVDISDEESGEIIYKKLIEKGYIISNRKSLFRIDPPLIISDDQFSGFIREFKRILDRK